MIRFTIDYPKAFAKEYGLNAYYAGLHWAVREQRADAWHRRVHAALRDESIRPRLFRKPVRITFFWDDRLDIDNHAIAAKCTVDALRGYLLENDSRRYVRAVGHRFWDRRCIGVEIEEFSRGEESV